MDLLESKFLCNTSSVGRHQLNELIKRHLGNFSGIQTPPNYGQALALASVVKSVKLREVFGQETIADPHLQTVFFFLEPSS